MNIFFNARQEPKKITKKEELPQYLLACIKNNGTPQMSEEAKAKKMAKILAKLKAGKKLSSEELEFLRQNDPAMYARAARIKKMAEEVEEQLTHAKSKEEANKIVSSAISGIAKDDPDKEYIVAAINRVAKEFRKSGAYSRLPDTDKDAKERKDKKSGNKLCKDDQNDEKSREDFSDWSPLQEVLDSMPKFSKNA